MYVSHNYKSKKELKIDVARYNELRVKSILVTPESEEYMKLSNRLTVFQPGPFGGEPPYKGRVYLEGPHYPQPHKWYAEAELEGGCIVKVK